MDGEPAIKRAKPDPNPGLVGSHFISHGSCREKNKRMVKECIHCMFIIPPEKAKPEALVLHVMETCEKISKADRDAFIRARAAEEAVKRTRAEAFPAEAAAAADLNEAGDGGTSSSAGDASLKKLRAEMWAKDDWDRKQVSETLQMNLLQVSMFLTGDAADVQPGSFGTNMYRRKIEEVCEALAGKPHEDLWSDYKRDYHQTKLVANHYDNEARDFRKVSEDISRLEHALSAASQQLKAEVAALDAAALARESAAKQLRQKQKHDAHLHFSQLYSVGTEFAAGARSVSGKFSAVFDADLLRNLDGVERRMKQLPPPVDPPGEAVTVADAPELARDMVARRCAQRVESVMELAAPLGFMDSMPPPPTPVPAKLSYMTTQPRPADVEGTSSAAKVVAALDAVATGGNGSSVVGVVDGGM
ncbi:hypothetical protein PLESTM_001312300 [Pleodorina starrii]|nr:hypothetical protein PLESTM_001312300 [Pleodorina starrii]